MIAKSPMRRITSPTKANSPTCTTSYKRTRFNPFAPTTGPAMRIIFPVGFSNPVSRSWFIFTLKRDVETDRPPDLLGQALPARRLRSERLPSGDGGGGQPLREIGRA